MKSKNLLVVFSLFFLLTTAIIVLAKPNVERLLAEVTHSKGKITVTVPIHATQVAPGLFDLGLSLDPQTNKLVQGYAYVHYKKANAKPSWAGGKPKNEESTCYSFLAKSAKWKANEPYMIDAYNTAGLNESLVKHIMRLAIDEWEDAADGEIDGSIVDLFGDEDLNGLVNAASIGVISNGQNEVIFADIDPEDPDSRAIAVTYVWGVFGGRPASRYLAEWDQVYDDVDFDWSAETNGVSGKMDFENIAQHELGHSFGLGHTDCAEETMHPTASNGETIKRDLNAGDIAGITSLYS
ncbi:matrixin family metalloprotease [Candidatus Woesearchaeota archaeon]|nr:matrixin family metalloprotease [Candidatus Woesearchaeota archaeon]